MGPQPIEIPDYFTVAWYREQKELKRNDEEIAAEMLISKALLQKWKKQIEWVPFSGKNIAGRKPTVDIGLLAEMRLQGIKRKDIARVLDISIGNVDHHLDRLGLSKKRKQA